MARERDLIRAIDKRANDQIQSYEAQHTLEVGVVKGLTYAGASVQLSESGRFLKDVGRTQGIDLVVGATVLVVRVTRKKWVILGALEGDNAVTTTTSNTVPVSAVQDLVCEDRPGYMEIRWTASYFQIECYEVQVNTTPSESGATTFVTDNSQFIYVDDEGTYYARVRAVGPNWNRGSWSSWVEGQVLVLSTTFADLTDTPAYYSGYSDHVPIVNATEDALEYLAFKLVSLRDTPDSLAGEAGKVLVVNDVEDGFEFEGLPGDYSDPGIVTLNFVIDGGGTAIVTGVKGDAVVDFACAIQSVTMLADQTGSIVVDIWKDVYANFPPADADSITASAPPTISSSNKSQDSTLSGWTTGITAGDILRFNVDSCSTITRTTLSLELLRL